MGCYPAKSLRFHLKLATAITDTLSASGAFATSVHPGIPWRPLRGALLMEPDNYLSPAQAIVDHQKLERHDRFGFGARRAGHGRSQLCGRLGMGEGWHGVKGAGGGRRESGISHKGFPAGPRMEFGRGPASHAAEDAVELRQRLETRRVGDLAHPRLGLD